MLRKLKKAMIMTSVCCQMVTYILIFPSLPKVSVFDARERQLWMDEGLVKGSNHKIHSDFFLFIPY